MIQVGIEEKKGNKICFVLHQDTNNLVKTSAKTAEAGIAKCFSMLDNKLFKERFLILSIEDGKPIGIKINNLYDFSLEGFSMDSLEEMIDKGNLEINAMHAFSRNDVKSCSYNFGNQELEILYEQLLFSEQTVLLSA